MPNAMFFLPFSNRRQKMKRRRWERNWKLLISHFSLIISFGLWGIKTRHFQTALKKASNLWLTTLLITFFLCRRHYIQLIFKWSQLPLLSLRSNAPLTIRGRKRHCLYVFQSEFGNWWYKAEIENVVLHHPSWYDENLWATFSSPTSTHIYNTFLRARLQNP